MSATFVVMVKLEVVLAFQLHLRNGASKIFELGHFFSKFSMFWLKQAKVAPPEILKKKSW
jgi:hypothetical protein